MKKLARVLAWSVLSGALGGGVAVGCSASGETGTLSGGGTGGKSSTGSSGDVCTPGTFRDCNCGLEPQGTQACAGNGTRWGACQCASMDAGYDGPTVCGDDICSGNETCATCPADCGQCAACTLAPSCTGADSEPASPSALASFNNMGQTKYTSGVGFCGSDTCLPAGSACGADGGGGSGSADCCGSCVSGTCAAPSCGPDGDPTQECSFPLLKMALSQIQVHKNGSSGGVEMFCMVQADDGQSSQFILTPDYMNLMDGNPALILSPSQGTFWGNSKSGVKLSQFNITITYTCYMVQQPDALQNALMAVSNFAGAAAGVPGDPYGWIFGAAGAAAAAAAAASAVGNGAVALLNVQQTISSDALMKLTNGYTWSIEETGSTQADGMCGFFGSCDWDWELDVEAWGCAAPKGQTPK